jgi:hypothetical protein
MALKVGCMNLGDPHGFHGNGYRLTIRRGKEAKKAVRESDWLIVEE